jgi:hypothetical protein
MQAAAASPLLGAPTGSAKLHYYELRYFYTRNGTQPGRTNDFLKDHWMPAAKRLGLGPVGVFQPLIGEQSPFHLVLTPFDSFAAVEGMMPSLLADSDFAGAYQAYQQAGPGYVRVETSILKAFDTLPGIVLPGGGTKESSHLFEMRTYESNNDLTLRRKVKMFNEGEIGIFQRLGMMPVFFGETIAGRNQPNLTYMLAYESLAARETVWNAFGSDPQWQKLRSVAGYSDAEIVSNISNMILRSAGYSGIR